MGYCLGYLGHKQSIFGAFLIMHNRKYWLYHIMRKKVVVFRGLNASSVGDGGFACAPQAPLGPALNLTAAIIFSLNTQTA